MKNLRIPTQSENSIDVSEIIKDFKGLVIAYNNTNPVGYIQYYDDSWYFLDSINGDSNTLLLQEDSLFELVTVLMKNNRCTHFKVIEFDEWK